MGAGAKERAQLSLRTCAPAHLRAEMRRESERKAPGPWGTGAVWGRGSWAVPERGGCRPEGAGRPSYAAWQGAGRPGYAAWQGRGVRSAGTDAERPVRRVRHILRHREDANYNDNQIPRHGGRNGHNPEPDNTKC